MTEDEKKVIEHWHDVAVCEGIDIPTSFSVSQYDRIVRGLCDKHKLKLLNLETS